MGRKRLPGLRKRGHCWHIEKQVKGYGRLYESTGTDNLEEAERYLAKRLEDIRQQVVYGIRPKRTFRQAATKYLNETQKRSLDRDAGCLKNLDRYIGEMPIEKIHMGTLQPYLQARKAAGVKRASVSRELAVVRRILTLAARVWRDDNNKPWIDTAPLLELPRWEDAAEPYPLSWEEQRRFFKLLPDYFHKMALFKVNTGLRAQGVCWLRWDWEFAIPELNTSIFITPGKPVQYADGLWTGEKNKEDQVVVLNRVAKSVIEGQRGLHPDYVFPHQDKRIYQINNSAWKTAWEKAGLPIDGSYTKGPHNLKHTFGRRLRAAGVPFEIRKVLLHHKSGDITTHYSPAELEELINAVEKIVEKESGKNPAFTLIRRNVVNG